MKTLRTLLFLSLIFILFSCDDTENKNEEKKDTSITLQDIEKYCQAVVSCGLETYPEIQTVCIERTHFMVAMSADSLLAKAEGFSSILPKYQMAFACVKNAKTCQDFASCTFQELTDEECEAKEICEGNTEVFCGSNNKKVKRNCEGLGMVCKQGEHSASCRPEPSNETCTAPVKCEENGDITFCNDGVTETVSCDSFIQGSTCKTVEGEVMCAVPETADDCNFDTYKVTCGKNMVTHCFSGKEVKTDCKQFLGEDFVCDENAPEDYFYCSHKDLTAQCDSEEVTCENGVLSYCIGGKDHSFNCKNHGYTDCTATTEELPAHCTL